MQKLNNFPDLKLLDDENTKQVEKDIDNLSEYERKRFSYVNPLKHNDFSRRRMYWSSPGEKLGRILILMTQLTNIIMAYFFGKFLFSDIIGNLVSNKDLFKNLNWSLKQGISNLTLIFTFIFAFLYYLPMIIINKAGGVYSWSIFYIMTAIAYFFFTELILSITLGLSTVISSLQISSSDQKVLPFFIVATFFNTIMWIVGACILLIKSDDIKKRISVEI